MKTILQKMKIALSTYLTAAKESMKQLDRMKKELLPEIVSSRTQAIYEQLSSVRNHSREQIAAAAEEGRYAAEEWGTLKGSDLTDDAKILQSGLTLTQKDFDDLCLRYKDNGSMSRLLADYAVKQNKQAIPLDPGTDSTFEAVLLTNKLQTLEKKLDQWNRLERSANMILSAIDGSGVAQGIDDPAVVFSVETFGDSVEV